MSNIPLGATVLTDLGRNSIINVESLNAFPIAVNSQINLPNIDPAYIWTKANNTLDNEFIPFDNTNISFLSFNNVANTWTATITTGATLISSTEASRISFSGIEITSLNGGAFVDLTAGVGGRPALAQSEQLISGFDSLGTTSGLSIFIENIGYVNNGGGITFDDAGGIIFTEANFVNQDGDHITLTGTLGFALFNTVIAAPSVGDAIFNIDSSLVIDTKIVIRDTFFDDSNGGTLFAAGGLDQTDPQVNAFNNGNALDSYWVGVMGFLDNATDTVIDFVDTYTDMAGTILAGANNERFTFSTNELTYIGLETKKFVINVHISLKKALGASARTVRAALFIDTGSGFVETGSAPLDMDNNLKSFGFAGVQILNTGTKLKVMIKNETNDDDILVVTYDVVVHEA